MYIKTIGNSISTILTRRGRGQVFSNSDFLDLGSPAAVRQALSRLARTGAIKRIATGLYYYPAFNKMLGGELPPALDAVAKAVARRADSRIVASGALAANLLGLSTQVPAKRVYLTNGRSRTVSVGRGALDFRHVSPRRMAAKGETSILVFEALRYLGQGNITDAVLNRLRRDLPAEAKAELRRDAPHAALWMRPLLERVLEEGK